MSPERSKPLEVWGEAALGFLYPEVCQLCEGARAGFADGYVCDRCRQHVVWVRPPFCHRCGQPYEGEIGQDFQCGNCAELDLRFDWARSAALGRGPVLETIRRYKYGRQVWFENFLAGLLLTQAGPALAGEAWDCIIPVPLYPLKERERQFNQAERLARRLSQEVGVPLETRLLRRVKATPSQTKLNRRERAANMRRAFALRRPRSLDGRRCLLVDDVLTTGSTTSACAQVLHEAGAEAVGVWTVARGV